jgi:hypothetical protein
LRPGSGFRGAGLGGGFEIRKNLHVMKAKKAAINLYSMEAGVGDEHKRMTG